VTRRVNSPDESDDLVPVVAWALHCWSCPLCYVNGIEAMGTSDQDHVTEDDRLQAHFLIGALGLHADSEVAG
jgi:hypothetical protein